MNRRTALTASVLGLFALAGASHAPAAEGPIRCLIITGDQVSAHVWQETTAALKAILEEGDKIAVDVTETPARDLTKDKLSNYDVLVLNYRETDNGTAETEWSDENKAALIDAVKGGTGLFVYHFASAAFANPNWEEYERMIGGGWRSQGFHGPRHEFTVKKTDVDHPISRGLTASFDHTIDELYQNSLMVEGNVVLATAYSDPDLDRGTGEDEAVIWVNSFGDGRVYNNALGHDTEALSNPDLQEWIRRGVEWAAIGDVKD